MAHAKGIDYRRPLSFDLLKIKADLKHSVLLKLLTHMSKTVISYRSMTDDPIDGVDDLLNVLLSIFLVQHFATLVRTTVVLHLSFRASVLTGLFPAAHSLGTSAVGCLMLILSDEAHLMYLCKIQPHPGVHVLAQSVLIIASNRAQSKHPCTRSILTGYFTVRFKGTWWA